LGLRDASVPSRGLKGSVLFIGDSLVWGYDVQADERFTEVLQQRLPLWRIVNAGVSGYGTDQEYLFLQRLWDRVEPSVVVLVFSTNTDRLDNSTNKQGGYYKPYYAAAAGQGDQFQGIPVPLSKSYLFASGHFETVAHLMLARLAVSLYDYFVQPEVSVPDPTFKLIALMKRYVESRGAQFLVGIQYADQRDPTFESWLQAQRIPYVSFDGAEHYPNHGQHWTPNGHAAVAERLLVFFDQTGVSEKLKAQKNAAVVLERSSR
jgi:hypothetical protein